MGKSDSDKANAGGGPKKKQKLEEEVHGQEFQEENEENQDNDRYELAHQLGAGSFGVIYLGTDKLGNKVAIKIQQAECGEKSYLKEEWRVYKQLQGIEGIAQYKWFGKTTLKGNLVVNSLALELLGSNIHDLLKLCRNKFSLRTVLLLADQLITCLEAIHSRHFVHRDIKSENMAIGLGSNSSTVYIIDFGLAKKYLLTNGDYMDYKLGHSFCGTARYASTNVHRGIEPDRRDDMIALGHVLLYFLRGKLPWQIEHDGMNKKVYYDRLLELKNQISVKELCVGVPVEFRNYMLSCEALTFGETPNYEYLRNMFRKLATRLNYKYDGVFDWNKL